MVSIYELTHDFNKMVKIESFKQAKILYESYIDAGVDFESTFHIDAIDDLSDWFEWAIGDIYISCLTSTCETFGFITDTWRADTIYNFNDVSDLVCISISPDAVMDILNS